MIIIGEKINGFIPSTLKAIEDRDEAFIRDLAIRQTEFGADYLDVCAGTLQAAEKDTLKWLISVVQDAVDTPISIDSSDTKVILDMLPLINKPGIINSISGEPGKREDILPEIAHTEWKLIALTCDSRGILSDPGVKFKIAGEIIAQANELGIEDGRIFIDPLVTTLATTGDALMSFMDAVKKIKAAYPDVHITSGLSNISYGMPYRKAINMQFLAYAMAAGMDSAIMDNTSADLRAVMYASAALLGRDEYCMEYIEAFRDGLIGTKKN